MDNIRELIPLIIILASFLFSYLSSSKKKKGNVNLPEPESMFPNPMEVVKPEPEKTIAPHLQRKLENLLQKEQETQKQSTKKSVMKESMKKKNSTVASIVFSEEVTEPFIDVSDHDEIKKAIIYSEIFSRKEY